MEEKTYYSIKISTGFEDSILFDKSFVSQIDEHDSKFLPVNIVVKKDDIKVSIVKIIIIDNLIYTEPRYMLELADGLDSKYVEVLEDFIKSAPFRKLKEDGFCRIAYISRVYVYPQYREKGIGSYLLENLEQILEETIRFNIGAFLTFFCPLDYDGNLWTANDDETMKEVMIDLFMSKGYKKIGKSENYIKFLY